MFKSYLAIAVRHILKYRGHALINISGLAVGITCCLLILLYVRYELSYDRFHRKADRIYRVALEERSATGTRHTASTPVPLFSALVSDIPEVENAIWLRPPAITWMIRYETNSFYEAGFFVTTPSVLQIFSLPLLKGNPETALERPLTVVLTDTMARKYFGEADPIGKVLRGEESMDFEVTGVMEDLPPNSHFQFDFLATLDESVLASPGEGRWRRNIKSYTYILLTPDAAPSVVEQKIPEVIEKYAGEQYRAANVRPTFSLQPLRDIHLHSHLEDEFSNNSNITYVYLFLAIAVFVLLIACINFMNLSTARAAMRAREIGIRKVVGADRSRLIRQFLGESLLVTLVALTVAYGLILLCLPAFNALTGVRLTLTAADHALILAGMIVIGGAVGLLSGSYPALVLSAFRPVEVFKGQTQSGTGRIGLRKLLVVAQFVISIVLIICTGLVYMQVQFMKDRRLGLQPEQVVMIPQTFSNTIDRYPEYKRRIRAHSRVVSVGASGLAPGRLTAIGASVYQSDEVADGERIELGTTGADEDFAATLGIEMTAGRFFSRAFGEDLNLGNYIINETAAKRLGFSPPEEALGKRMDWLPGRGGSNERVPHTIIGIMKDFHIRSLHEPIEPVVLFHTDSGPRVYVKLRVEDLSQTLTFLRDTWFDVNPNFAFEYSFLDEDFARLYHAEERLVSIFGSFSILALFIGCLGLFGLTAITSEQRTKEIGVRKVLGASIPDLVVLLSREYLILVALANVFAWPIAYFGMNAWLQEFAYRMEIGPAIFFLAALLTLLIALLTVGYRTVKAALANPVQSLRYE